MQPTEVKAPTRRAPLRIGMIGAGFMGRTHSAAYQAAATAFGPDLPSAELMRIVDIERGAAEAVARRYGWNCTSTDWRAITRADDVDLVDIVTPNDQHAAAAIDAARHGKAIVCEKPLAEDVQTAHGIYQVVRETGVANHLAHRSRPLSRRRLRASRGAHADAARGTAGRHRSRGCR